MEVGVGDAGILMSGSGASGQFAAAEAAEQPRDRVVFFLRISPSVPSVDDKAGAAVRLALKASSCRSPDKPVRAGRLELRVGVRCGKACRPVRAAVSPSL